MDLNWGDLQAWRALTLDGRYRVANADDFAFSEASKLKLQQMFGKDSWYQRINYPAVTGDISRENWFYDLAVIVIDTTWSDAGRFGMVIFNVPKDGKHSSAHWAFS